MADPFPNRTSVYSSLGPHLGCSFQTATDPQAFVYVVSSRPIVSPRLLLVGQQRPLAPAVRQLLNQVVLRHPRSVWSWLQLLLHFPRLNEQDDKVRATLCAKGNRAIIIQLSPETVGYRAQPSRCKDS